MRCGVLKPEVPFTHNTEESQKEMPSFFFFFSLKFLKILCHFIVAEAILTDGSTTFDLEQQRFVCI